MNFDERFSQEIEAAIGQIEAATDAEVVVVACRQSDDYRDTVVLGGACVSALMLVAVLFLPWTFSPLSVLEIHVASFLGGCLATWRSPTLRRILTTRRRRHREVDRRLQLEVTRQNLTATPERNGVLVLVSLLEDRAVLHPDFGLERRVPRGELELCLEGLRPRRDGLEGLTAALTRLGMRLGAVWPKTATDRDDLPNLPHVVTR